MSETKRCSKCGEVKARAEFYKESNKSDGLNCYCKVCCYSYQKQYHQDNQNYVQVRARQYRQNNHDREREYGRLYRKNNKPEKNQRDKQRYHQDPYVRLTHILRRRVRAALKGLGKSAPTMELLGCSIEFFKEYIESQFQDGMTWENYGLHGWHIDHYIPCSAFDLTDPEQQRICFNYTNLRPMFAKDNMSKGAKLPEEWEEYKNG